MKQLYFFKLESLKRICLSVIVLAFASSMVSMSVGARQGNAGFQVSLKIVARAPAPRVTQQVISAASPGYPVHPVFEGRAVTEEKSGQAFIVLTTEF